MSNAVFSSVLLLLVGAAVWGARDWDLQARLFPWAIGIPLAVLLVIEAVRSLRQPKLAAAVSGGATATSEEDAGELDLSTPEARRRFALICGWLLGFAVSIWLLGFPVGGTLAAAAYLRLTAREGWLATALLCVGIAAFFYLGMEFLKVPFPPGLLLEAR
ncbi:MAG TPA: tripartite tricarboxylate transporter TctB family protein [Chloroflexota bacterium]